MGERDIDRIIEQWRAEARAAGESAPGEEPTRHQAGSRLRRVRTLRVGLLRLGRVRLAAGLVAVVAFAAVAVPVLGGTAAPPVAGGPEPGAAPAPGVEAEPRAPASTADPAPDPPSPKVDDWFALLEQVDRARGEAYATGDPSALVGSFHPEGPALVRERAMLASLRSAGARVAGWDTDLLAVSPLEVGPQQVVVRVADRRGGYRVLGADGSATEVPAADRAAWLVTLRPEGQRWLVHDALAQPEAATNRPSQP